MSTSSSQNPTSLKQVLATTPLLHLIPKQNLSPLINLSSFIPITDESSFLRPTHINEFNTLESKQFELECQKELLEFEDDELDNIKFKSYPTIKDDNFQPPEYSNFELEILNNININKKKIIDTDDDEQIQTSRISVRGQIPIDDDIYLKKHNYKYFTKFEKESSTLIDRDALLKQQATIEIQQNLPSTSFNASAPNPDDKLATIGVSDLKQFIQNSHKLTWERTAGLCESLNKIETLQDEDRADLIIIEEILYQNLSIIVEKKQTLKIVDDVNTLLPDFLIGTFASKALMIIIKYQIGKQIKMSFGKYTSIIVKTLELMYENFLVPLEKLFQEITDLFAEKSITKLVIESSNRFKQLDSLKTAFEDESIAKLEALCITISLSGKFNESEAFLEKLPITILQQNAATCLINIFKNHKDQRLNLVSNVLVDFTSLEYKRQHARKFKTERGFNIQLFTMILNNFACLDPDPTNITELISAEIIKKLPEQQAENKLRFEMLIDDLFNLLPYPEWPVADIILWSLIEKLMLTSDKEESIPGELQLLDHLINICERILNQKYEKDMFLNEEALKNILGNCLGFDDTKVAYTYLNTRLQILTNIIMEEELKKNKIQEPIEAYRAMIFSRLSQLVITKSYSFIIRKLSHSKAIIRAKAIKGLQIFLQDFPELLATPEVLKQLTDRMHDQAIKVREAMNDFLGKYAKKNPNDAEKVINPLYLALDDPGLSVRKSAIKSCMENFNFVGPLAKVKISLKFLERTTDEEDGVRNEAVAALLEIFFKDKEGVNFLIGVAKDSKSLLKPFLENNFEKIPERVVPDLVDLIASSDKIEELDGAFVTLAIITQLKPELITQDILSALKPFYMDTNYINTVAYTNALLVLKSSTSKLSAIRPELSLDIQNFLYHKLIFFQSHDISLATQALWNLGKLSSTELKGVSAVISAMRNIRTFHDQKTYDKIFKHLQILGSFGKYFQLQKFRHVFVQEGIVPQSCATVMSILVKYIIAFTSDKFPMVLRKYAYTNIILACSNNPTFMTDNAILRIIENGLGLDDEIKFNIIRVISEFINDNGEKIESTEFNSNENPEKNKDSGYNTCCVLVDRFYNTISELSLKATSTDLSELAFVFVRKSLKLGLIIPMKGIKIIIALHGSAILRIQQSAHELYSEFYDKNKSFVDTQHIAGIKLAFENELIANNIISLLYAKNNKTKTSRNKFITSISRLFAIKHKSQITKDELLFIVFIIERIYKIKFKTLEEIFIILEQLQNTLQYTVPEFISDLKDNGVKPDDHYKGLLLHLLLEFYDYLTTMYNISLENIEAFTARYLELDLEQSPKILKAPPELHFGWIFDNVDDPKSLERAAITANKSIFNQ
ncbi:SCC2 [Candida jiufengensis]|uniref:SCC2 n=1 Tax=Candida jiufengensis TaxID=497108 RepID=UPI0022256060|nr:SCC2 [Candida jiufengensis]KAI5954898.1 SCC2 [Candida jiufengensis]